MERCWMIHDRGNQLGPHTEMELATLVAVGTVGQTAMVWRTGSPRWIPISSVVPMPAYLPPAPPQSTPYSPAGGQSSNRVAAGIFGILLGGLGIHKFMLGFTQAGLIMLLVSVFGSCLYGVGPIIMAVIGLIEGIIYLTKSDAQFHQEYVVQKKQWF
jgi:TM2 domain-containing membrane protein YozV